MFKYNKNVLKCKIPPFGSFCKVLELSSCVVIWRLWVWVECRLSHQAGWGSGCIERTDRQL